MARVQVQFPQPNQFIQCFQGLLNMGVDLSVQNELGETPLVLALKYKLFDFANLILNEDDEKVARIVNIPDENGWTALHYACLFHSRVPYFDTLNFNVLFRNFFITSYF